MRKAGMYSFVLLLAMSVATAQQEEERAFPATQEQQQEQEAPAVAQPMPEQDMTATQEQESLRGCLVRKDDGQFALKDEAGQRYRVEGEEGQLSAHANHQVELRGNIERDFEAEPREGVADPTAEEPIAGSIQVDELVHLAETCPDDATGAAAIHEDEAMTEERAATETEATDPYATETEQDQLATETETTDPFATETETETQEQEFAATETEQDAAEEPAVIARQDDPALAQEQDEAVIAREDDDLIARDDEATVATETETEFGETESALDAQQEQQEVAQWDDQAMLPQTASPLPLLMLLGLGSLLAGWFVRRK